MAGEFIIEGVIMYAEEPITGMSKTGNPWTKQGVVLQTQERYPRTVYFTVWGKNIPEGGVQQGARYEVALDVSSQEYQGKWYTNATGYRLTPVGATQAQQPTPQPQQQWQAPQPAPAQGLNEDEIPF